MKRHAQGLTLIELMVVVGIIAILATVAMVSWGNYVRRSARSDAMAALMDLRVKQERYRFTNPSYANRVQYSSVFQPAGDPLPALSPNRKYLIDVATASVTGFTATATPQGSQNSQAERDECGGSATFAVNQEGPVMGGAYAGAGCWKR
jgi:type IV pilus assembly protein PilE